ncbi:MAG: hypothetical protein NC206_00155 [Bacteroides sp.]|nr:hypothetical protein [Roseburia sp.]MCM1345488.1 hypothetical protein [Bacteroides sp.]MCM1419997.1 hypothetical protein [Bacteroides sp.]
MTDEERQKLKNFDAHVRQLIAQYKVLQKENNDLYTELESKELEIERLQAKIGKCKSDYSNLKLAKMIEISDGDMKDAKQRITRLVREVNKCIALLSTEQPITE